MVAAETAFEWWQRSESSRKRCHNEEPPRDVEGAAWAFVQPRLDPGSHATTSVFGTGVSFIDAAILQCIHNQHATSVIPRGIISATRSRGSSSRLRRQPPVLEILGDHGSGKTWSLMALVARFLVATRRTRFSCSNDGAKENNRHDDDDDDDHEYDLDDECSCGAADTPPPTPQVILFDSNYGVYVVKLARVVRTLLLQEYQSKAEDDKECMTQDDPPDWCSAISDQLEYDLNECLSRFHIVTSDDLAGWVPILESIREHMERTLHTSGPTLLLWDGFLSEPLLLQTDAIKREVVRQLERLLTECSRCLAMTVVSTTTTPSATSEGAAAQQHTRGLTDWEKLVTRRIYLRRIVRRGSATTCSPADEPHHEQETHVATILGSTQQTTIPFSISEAGLPT
jgi:hypothetical protein